MGGFLMSDNHASRRDILKGGSAFAFGLTLGSTAGPLRAQTRQMGAREKEFYEAAKKEGELTWYTAHSDDVTAQALGRTFESMYPGLKVNVVRTSGGLVAMAHNTAKLPAAEAPKNWTDLADPKWKDKISFGHPGFSGYVGTWTVMMRKLYGWQFFDKLAKNNPQIGRSINDTVTMLNAGERVVAGHSPSGPTQQSAQKGNPLAMIWPTDGTVLIIAPSGIMKGAKHPNAARLYMEYLLTAEASKVW